MGCAVGLTPVFNRSSCAEQKAGTISNSIGAITYEGEQR